mmetsp:Transcript_2262/g.3979  ORF Transcript_2262/g.3979 Transcript_2262/m.3979 type:complete len:133 (-) Transcript_2262:725-1123(-)
MQEFVECLVLSRNVVELSDDEMFWSAWSESYCGFECKESQYESGRVSVPFELSVKLIYDILSVFEEKGRTLEWNLESKIVRLLDTFAAKKLEYTCESEMKVIAQIISLAGNINNRITQSAFNLLMKCDALAR